MAASPGNNQNENSGKDRDEYTNELGMTFVEIKSGTFLMGSPPQEPDREADEQQHEVTLTSGFFMQTTEVTIGQYRKFLEATGFEEGVAWDEIDCPIRRNRHYTLRGTGYGLNDNQPMVNVSWHAAVAFADWLSQKTGETYRLPTEAEWEYVCRAGSTAAYCFGDNPALLDRYVPSYGVGLCGTHPVGLKAPNAWGVYDMHGNVCEWCADWKSEYPSEPVVDPIGPMNGTRRVFRSWCGISDRLCRCASRVAQHPDYCSYKIGFRLVKEQNQRSVRGKWKTAGEAQVRESQADRYPGLATGADDAGMASEITNFLDMRFVRIRPGTFLMGSPIDEMGRYGDETQHAVSITRGFYMQTTEVTQGQWRKVMGDNPSYFDAGGKNCPVEKVSWNEAQEFIQKLNQQDKNGLQYRLPTEAEWEFACRAGASIGSTEKNNSANLKDFAWFVDNGERRPHPVAGKQPSARGLYDMQGNVWEWCADWWEAFSTESAVDPRGPSEGWYRIARGGSFLDGPGFCRPAFRYRFVSNSQNCHLGFRLVCQVSE